MVRGVWRGLKMGTHRGVPLLLLFVMPCCLGAAGDMVDFALSFERGYNLRDRPEEMQSGYFTGWSYNVVPQADGTAKKRPGTVPDKALAGKDTSVNLLAYAEIGYSIYPRMWTLGVAGPKWFKRDNQQSEGTWTALTVPAALRTGGDDDLQAIMYDRILVGGGECSALWRFDGDSIYRLIIPTRLDSCGKADTVTATGSLDTMRIYRYGMTATDRHGNESWGWAVITDTTSTTARAINLYELPKYPREFAGSKDTALIAYRTLYRDDLNIEPGLRLYPWAAEGLEFYTVLPNMTDTAFVDSGQYTPDPSKRMPEYEYVEQAGHFPAEHGGMLWTVPKKQEARSQFTLTGAIGNTNRVIGVTPWIGAQTVKAQSGRYALVQEWTAMPWNRMSWRPISDIDMYSPYDYYDGKFLSAGVRAGEYVVWGKADWESEPAGACGNQIGTMAARFGITVLVGDADSNGVVDIHDARLIQMHVLDPSIWIGVAADVSDNGSISAYDASLVLICIEAIRQPLDLPNSMGASVVLSVPAESLLVIDGQNIPLAGYTDIYASVGRNLYRIDNEIIGVISAGGVRGFPTLPANSWLVVRGLFGTTAAAHSAGAPLYLVEEQESDAAIWTESYNPLRQVNAADPLVVAPGEGGRVKGMGSMAGSWLRMSKEHATFGISGTGEYSFTPQRVAERGAASSRAIEPYGGGIVSVDQSGPYYMASDGQITDFGAVLGSAVTDSASALMLGKAAAKIHEQVLYLSVQRDATTGRTKTWRYDMRQGTWTVFEGWAANVWGRWPQASDGRYRLYYGQRDSGNVVRVDPAALSDKGLAIATRIETPIYQSIDPVMWTELQIGIEHSDNVTITARTWNQVGELTTTIIATITAASGDTTALGVMRPRRFPINREGVAIQLIFESIGTGRYEIGRGRVYGRGKQL